MIELTTKLLIYILVFIVVFSFSIFMLKRIFKNTMPAVIASLSVALLATWFLSEGQIELLEQTYGVAQIILIGVLPFAIFSSFVYLFLDISGIVRKILWVAYGILNIVFFSNSGIENSSSFVVGYILLTLLMVVFDSPIRNFISVRKNLKKG